MVRDGPDLGRELPPRSHAADATEVQVFGLVGPERVQVQCPGAAMRIAGGVAERLTPESQTLASALAPGMLLCTGGPGRSESPAPLFAHTPEFFSGAQRPIASPSPGPLRARPEPGEAPASSFAPPWVRTSPAC
jgi:hypothetical protein